MDKLIAWLRVEPTGFKLWWFFAKILVLMFAVEFLFGALLNIFGVPLRDETTLLIYLEESPIVFLFLVLPSLALLEEVFFRLPLAIFIAARGHPMVIFVVAIMLSAIFGYAHGGWWQIPLQGVSGFMLCIIFLKCGGLQNKYGKALLSSSCIHLISNWIAFYLMAVWGM
ncbi:MAG: hypothetical protein A3D65_02040 [Candidatus Lloydbacteria bacterium RIFCSPHIGHO2_02_FULL_50_13]|uniref:CAAX prenyl protease 2/Lysostaphin resistance protein A-like domain-containing protein n=1 Tax=Candidatus Lloydbacteria bacterium RIFCSPHIGHO2_02_FULL_50_13 TaxID=1798661 RepID=A0A1G2D170_9BACT|nr:MAG: hypothetical protein A3D65_02040 [Candidatus Lloydbacteria bacterium RIFCSPHIGHO2_02_FULL_50_13]